MGEDIKENRQYPRAPIKVEVLCEELDEEQRRGTAVLCFYSTNISLGGVFLETTVPMPIDSTVHMKFSLPHVDRQLSVTGKVVRIQKHPNLLPGIGIEFIHLSYEDKKIIEGYVVDEIAGQL